MASISAQVDARVLAGKFEICGRPMLVQSNCSKVMRVPKQMRMRPVGHAQLSRGKSSLLASYISFASDVAGNDLPMALVQEAESPRAQIGKYFLWVFLCGQLLPRDRVPGHPLLIFLRRLPCCHPHPPADIVRELEHGHMDGGGHGQSTGGATDSVYMYILVPLWDCKSEHKIYAFRVVV